MSTMKPSRSEEETDPNHQIDISNQTRAEFDSLAPKRATKPSRSEPQPPGSFSSSDNITDTPEADKLRSLSSQPHGKLLGEDSSKAQDEFLETDYYQNLTAVDKQHHTTGSGFIEVAKEGGEETVTAADIGDGEGGGGRIFGGNPATNEWIPAVEEDRVSMLSSKPNRSDT